jgi:hypothetical protein
MKLELPPERPLPRAEWMVERILAESSSSAAGREFGARIYWIGGLVAAAVTITAAVIGWVVLIPTGQTQVGAPPATTAAPSDAPPSTVASRTPSRLKSSPAASPTIRPSSGQSTSASRRPPRTAVPSRTPTPTQSISTPAETTKPEQASTPPAHSEPPVTTTVPIGVRVQAPYLDLTASGTMRGGDVYAVLVETCVRSLLPDSSEGLVLSRSSWTLSTSQGTVGADAPITDPISLPTSYPEEGIYLVGECAQGWIPFGVGPDTTVTAIRYRNSLGADVTWNPNT